MDRGLLASCHGSSRCRGRACHSLAPRQASPSGGTIELGIVPFDTDGDGAAELGESFRLDLMDAMSEVPLVQVRAAQSLSNLKEDDASVLALSKKVDVTVLLFGHLKLRGDNCQVRMELVRARDAVHLASLQYRGSEAELASIRERAQRDIYEQLRLAGKPVQQMKGGTTSPRAYEMYLRARYHLSQRTDESTRKALDEFAAAVKEDPDFARAYAGMATTDLIRADYSFSRAKESYAKAEELARSALQSGARWAMCYSAASGMLPWRSRSCAGPSNSNLARRSTMYGMQSSSRMWAALTRVSSKSISPTRRTRCGLPSMGPKPSLPATRETTPGNLRRPESCWNLCRIGLRRTMIWRGPFGTRTSTRRRSENGNEWPPWKGTKAGRILKIKALRLFAGEESLPMRGFVWLRQRMASTTAGIPMILFRPSGMPMLESGRKRLRNWKI